MDAMTFWKEAGTPLCKQVCERADITFGHFKHVAHGRRQLLPETAVKLATESAKLTRRGMTVLALLKLDHLPPRVLGTGTRRKD